jgi:hypothetical protein
MIRAEDQLFVSGRGIHIHGKTRLEVEEFRRSFLDRLRELGIEQHVQTELGAFSNSPMIEFSLTETSAAELAPGCDTTQICKKLNLDTQNNSCDLEREILLAMLVGPIPFEYPSFEELATSVRVRSGIVEAARKTALAFATAAAERPADYWAYDEDHGFLVLPGKSLIEALQKATQPEISGTLYSFSCSRATEHVIALAVVQEAAARNPELYAKLQRQAETRAIKGREFNQVFCREYGTWTQPLPVRYFVPGDRNWFCNPDLHSSDAPGYEGSWVFYLGDCLFTNFWKRDKPFSLTDKYVEIFHWRDATFRDDDGELRINESTVEACVQAALQDPVKVEEIIKKMEQIYDPDRVRLEAGCIDISRQYPRWVCPGTSDIVLPDVV